MHSYLVAVVDGAHARFLTFSTAEFPDTELTSSHLTEHSSLNSAEKPLAVKREADNPIGRKHHGQRHDRPKQSAEMDRRFASLVVEQLNSVAQDARSQQIVLAAEPHVLGHLRELIPSHFSAAVEIRELAKDLCRLRPHDLHQYLAGKKLLPPPRRLR